MKTPNIYNLLQECKTESDIEEKYKRIINYYFPKATISSPYNTDGVLKNSLTMLMEFKYNKDLTKRSELIEVIIQLLYYLKSFERHGDELPTIVFGGDLDECFCLHSNSLLPYLKENINWSLSPSAAPFKNPELSKKLYEDKNINPYIFNINNDHFDFEFVVDKIKQLHKRTVQKLYITELNINRFFSYFKDKIIRQKNKYSSETLVSIFLGCLIDPDNNYPHPKKKNFLVTPTRDIIINRSIFDSFFNHFETTYSIEEKRRLTAICDRLIADEERRFRGEFYTPTEWVLEAHKMIEKVFGPNWKEEYVVWDPAWGTGNLTRDFKFKELYCSTLHYGDLEIGRHYNPEAVKFQYDFLNDDVYPEGTIGLEEDKLKKLAPGLVKAFEKNKPMIIFMNPPYLKGSGGFKISLSGRKSVVVRNLVNYLMTSLNLGKCSAQLYFNFLYRIMIMKKHFKCTNVHIGIFCPPLYITGPDSLKFRQLFLNEFEVVKAFLMPGNEFESVSGNFGISFSILSSGLEQKSEFVFDLKEFVEYEIKTTGSIIVYNLDNDVKSSDWIREHINGIKTEDYPKLSSAITVKENDQNSRFIPGFIGSMYNVGNNIESNAKNVALLSACYSNSQNAPPITENNFSRIISLFCARKAIESSWSNCKKEYLAPNEQHSEYPQWNTDAIIYSLFNGSSNQSSLRKITYKNKLWDIKNEWFWMPNSHMLQLANEHSFDELYYDAQGDHDRFVFKKIQESTFSEDAAEVLNKAIELVIKTFPYRKQLHEENPEWHLHAWDAGWYQIKLVLKKYFKDDLKEFNELYKKFEDRMREGVYKFGFLK